MRILIFFQGLVRFEKEYLVTLLLIDLMELKVYNLVNTLLPVFSKVEVAWRHLLIQRQQQNTFIGKLLLKLKWETFSIVMTALKILIA